MSQINKYSFFFFFLSEEQLEEDKLHSNGGKVLSSELRNTHFGCSPSNIVSESLFVSHSAESLVSVEVSLCYDSCSFALFCFGFFFFYFFLTLSLHPFMFNLFHISIFKHHCTTNTFTSDNSKVNSSLPKLSTFAGHKCLPAAKITFTAAIKKWS